MITNCLEWKQKNYNFFFCCFQIDPRLRYNIRQKVSEYRKNKINYNPNRNLLGQKVTPKYKRESRKLHMESKYVKPKIFVKK